MKKEQYEKIEEQIADLKRAFGSFKGTPGAVSRLLEELLEALLIEAQTIEMDLMETPSGSHAGQTLLSEVTEAARAIASAKQHLGNFRQKWLHR